MAQWIITIGILAAALAYALYRIRKYFRKRVLNARKGPALCDGCHSDCGSCALVPEADREAPIGAGGEKPVDKE
jgi:hypothetical protein